MKTKIKNKFSKSIWKKESEKFENLAKKAKIPDARLRKVDCVLLKKEEDFEKIPEEGGCYWIWTNEPVHHMFHKNPIPKKFEGGEIIYNGIAKDNVRARIRGHLLVDEDAKWSAISLDIYPHKSESHRKKAMSTSRKEKVPYLCIDKGHDYNRSSVRSKKLLLKLFLSSEERKYIRNSGERVFYFRNGINVSEKKHKKYKFRVYFITSPTRLNWLFLEFVEKNWREQFDLPRLCSYSSGR